MKLPGKIKNFLFPQNSKRKFFAKMLKKFFMNPSVFFSNINTANLKKIIFYAGRLEPDELEKRINGKLFEYSHNPSEKPQTEETVLISKETSNAGEYVDAVKNEIPSTGLRLIAFYLPQYHPIPENDMWWGKDFTEWVNVNRGRPRYHGHYQPRVPGELGYYDLRNPEIRRRQVELARGYGLFGFCFHFYWFGGKTLLELPIEGFAADDKIDFPFCLNWANENWTRRWDGMEKDVLIAQKHSPDDDLNFIRHISRYLKHKNYIKVNGRPLLMVYRVSLLPDAAKTAARWRKWCRENGIGEIYLALAHSFEHDNPKKCGFDAAVEFSPNTYPVKDAAAVVESLSEDFKGRVFDYREAVNIGRNFKKPDYKKLRGVCPGWENEARKPGRGTIFANASPELYKAWLKEVIKYTSENFTNDERMVFINAWNEWSEGAYLEPDNRTGYAALQATAEAIIEANCG